MTKDELIKLRHLVLEETNKRNESNNLLNIKEVQEFVKLIEDNYMTLFSNEYPEVIRKFMVFIGNRKIERYLELSRENFGEILSTEPWDIIKPYLEHNRIEQTNGIYVCTDYFAVVEKTMYTDSETFSIPFNKFYSCAKLVREYKDIENKVKIKSRVFKRDGIATSIFEEENIVINPHNKSEEENGYEEVRREFFNNTLEKGQEEAKKLLLTKYPQMNKRQ